MRQFYLINDNLSEQKLAEEYLEDEYNLNPNIQESVLRIINFLSNVTLDSSGNIEQLKPEVKKGLLLDILLRMSTKFQILTDISSTRLLKN